MVHDEEELLAAVGRGEDLTDGFAGVLERAVRTRFVSERTGVADGDHLGGLVDDRVGDHVQTGGIRKLVGRGDESPAIRSRGVVEGVDEARQRLVGLLAQRRRVLDLHETHDRGVEGVDRGDDLGFLTREVRRIPGSALVASVADVVQLRAVGALERRARGTVGAEGGEVVQDVEGCHADVAADLFGGGGADVLELHAVGGTRSVTGERRGRVELEGVVAIVDDHRLGEGDGGPHHDRLGERDVRRGQGGVRGGEEVRARSVVEDDATCGVLSGHRGGLRRARERDLGRLQERTVAEGERNLAVLVRAVGVGDGERALGLDQHRLERFTTRLVGRPAGGEGRDRCAVSDDLDGSGADVDLGQSVELGRQACHPDGLPEGDLTHGARRVHEDRVGRGACGGSGTGRLNDEAREAAGRVVRGHDALGDDGLAVQGRRGAGALDLGDRDGGRSRRFRIRGRLGVRRRLRVHSARRALGCRRARGEVGGVDGGVRAVGIARDARAVRRRGRRAPGRIGGAAPAEVIHDLGESCHIRSARKRLGRVDERDLALGPRHRDAPLDIGVETGERRVASRRLTNEQLPTRLDRHPRERGDLPGCARGGRVLHAPRTEVDRGVTGVDQFDEVAVERRTVIAAAAVHLVDEDGGVDADGRLSGKGETHAAQREGAREEADAERPGPPSRSAWSGGWGTGCHGHRHSPGFVCTDEQRPEHDETIVRGHAVRSLPNSRSRG